jgi:hypothetical protein
MVFANALPKRCFGGDSRNEIIAMNGWILATFALYFSSL